MKKTARDFWKECCRLKFDYVEISKEKSIVYHPEYKGVRLDVYAKDENHTRYNVEMQVQKKVGTWKEESLLPKPDGYGDAANG